MTEPQPTRSPRPRRSLAAAILLTSLVAGACGDSKKPPKPSEDRLLVIDGITITFEDLQPYADFLGSYLPESGTKSRYMQALKSHELPLRVGRRTFPAERQKQLEGAQALCAVATNVMELEEKTELLRHKRRTNLVRAKALLPVAMFLFEQLNTSAVSPPIEVPHGWFVVSSYDYYESPLVISDYVDALQIGFVTHTSGEWNDWWDEEKVRLGKKVTFVHPDYRDDMPKWVQLPENS